MRGNLGSDRKTEPVYPDEDGGVRMNAEIERLRDEELDAAGALAESIEETALGISTDWNRGKDGPLDPPKEWRVGRPEQILAALARRGYVVRAALATPPETAAEPATLNVERPFDADRMTAAWAILEAEVVVVSGEIVPNPSRWEPDRYNAAAFVTALLAKYAAHPAAGADRDG